MKLNAKRLLFYSFVMLFIMACRLYQCGGGSQYQTLDNVTLFCKGFNDYGLSLYGTYGIECSLPCPDGNTIQIDLYSGYSSQLIGSSLATLQGKYCPANPSPTEAPTDVPTDEPTEEPAPPTDAPTDAPPTEAAPLLQGTVTACDTGMGYINFPFAPPVPDLTGKSLNVTFNGSPVNCGAASNNPNILSCSLSGNSFPLNVNIEVDGIQTDSFTFDGGICTYTDPNPPPSNTDDNPPNTDTSCDPFTDSSCPVEDCSNPDYSDLPQCAGG
ncbi:MAG: hypothetical protein H6634_16420 [Anaerolineales bacterium]|nr:hypothetical protein [Anaerolineales bacterium]